MDAFVTDIVGVPLMVRFADCQVILMFEPEKKVAAAVHCGWRGNVKNVVGKTVGIMKRNFDCEPGKILVGISASLGSCCAEFGDPRKELPDWMQKYVKNKRVDLWECSLGQLTATGVRRSNVELAGKCTVCENKEFFSYRAGGRKTGHMGAVIELI